MRSESARVLVARHLELGALLLAFAVVALPAGRIWAETSPYVSELARRVKALAPEREQALREGAGHGYAMAAELNGHGGPKHVLELATELALSAEQRSAVQASFERMHSEAVRLGGEIVAAEEMLDRRFAHHHIDETMLADMTRHLGALEGELRFVHLRAHLETEALLTEAQRGRYIELRGYAAATSAAPGDMHVGHHPSR